MAKASQRLLRYGSNQLWSTPVTLGNLLEEGVVEEKLHKWLEEYADDPRLAFGPPSDLDKKEKRYSRVDITLFAPPANRELARIKEILIGRADRYARETIMGPLPDHEKHAGFVADVEMCSEVDRYDFAMVGQPNGTAVELRGH